MGETGWTRAMCIAIAALASHGADGAAIVVWAGPERAIRKDFADRPMEDER
jgi:hypothetical protein